MSVRFKWPPDLAAFRFGSALIWALRGGGIPATVTGISPLSLINAIARPITKLLQHGKVAVSGTDVVCNNGTLKFGAIGNNLAEMSEETVVIGKYISATGSINVDVNNFFYQSYISVTPNTTYTLTASKTCYFISISEYQADKTFIVRNAGNTNIKELTITTGADTYFIRFGSNMDRASMSLEKVLDVNWMLNKGNALPYEPFISGIYADGTPETITLSAAGAEDQTANAENLFAVGDIEDTQDIISGTVTRRTEAVVSDGTTPTGRYVGTVGEGNIIVKARETGYTGEIVSFETEEETPLNGLIVEMEPVQDLHGYDSPWPAGGGKNLLNVNSQATGTLSGMVVTSDANYITVNGTKYGASYNPISSMPITLPAGTYYVKSFLISGTKTEAASFDVWLNVDSNTQLASQTFTQEKTFTLESETTFYINLFSSDNAVYTNYKFGVVISKTSGIDKFYPYSNICPISGWTGVSVQRTRKNLFDQSSTPTIMDCYGDGGFVTTRRAYKIELPTGTYTISAIKNPAISAGAFIYLNRVNKDGSFASFHYLITSTATSATITLSLADGQYFLLYDAQASLPSDVNKFSYFDFQIELGSTATVYEEYRGSSYSVTFPDEVFGATPDLVSGEMPVTMRMIDLGTLTWSKAEQGGQTFFYASLPNGSKDDTTPCVCSMYKAAMMALEFQDNDRICRHYGSEYWNFSRIGIKDSAYNDLTAAEFKTAMSGVQLVYMLIAPIQINITPTPVSTLEGENNIWSNAGAVSVYVPTGDLIEKVTPQKLSTAEGDNTITVTAEVEDIVFDVTYSENNPDG